MKQSITVKIINFVMVYLVSSGISAFGQQKNNSGKIDVSRHKLVTISEYNVYPKEDQEKVYVYSEPDSNSKKVGYFPSSGIIDVRNQTDNYYYIKATDYYGKAREGYILDRFVEQSERSSYEPILSKSNKSKFLAPVIPANRQLLKSFATSTLFYKSLSSFLNEIVYDSVKDTYSKASYTDISARIENLEYSIIDQERLLYRIYRSNPKKEFLRIMLKSFCGTTSLVSKIETYCSLRFKNPPIYLRDLKIRFDIEEEAQERQEKFTKLVSE